ncbi:unnamed protein product [Mytilus coruscus]|uniref:Uncharacterized protein n=1 Tax=Mytilus coruscus TaxID=42192 RepID=A0A6J8CB90_MYTCO|nr:unnamed protein product [Mytilus coruscus]
MEKMICVQQHFSSVLEEHTSKLEDLNGKVDNMAMEMQKRITQDIGSLKQELKFTMRKMDEKQNKLTRRTLALRTEKRLLNKNMCTNPVKDSPTVTDKSSEFIRWKDENLAKLSIIIKKIFTLVLRRAFRTEWNRQYPNNPWLDNTVSRKKLLELERRPSKRGRICQEQIRKGDGDVNSWDFSLLAHLLCHSKALDLKNRNIQLYNGTYQVLEYYKKFSGMKCFEINRKEFDTMYHQIHHCFEVVPEFRSSCDMLYDIKQANIHISLTEPSHQLVNCQVKRHEGIEQYLLWLLLAALMCFVYWGKRKIEEIQMSFSCQNLTSTDLKQ